MAKPPAFQFYPADWLSDENVALMTLEEEGAHFRAIREAATRGDSVFLAPFPYIGALTWHQARHSRYISKPLRKRILAWGACAYCSSEADLQVDHVTPIAKGGTSEEHNLQPLCGPCNRRKAAKI